MSGTRVTAVDLESGEEETIEIRDDYVITTDGGCYVDGVQMHANGTHVVTIKRSRPPSIRALVNGEEAAS